VSFAGWIVTIHICLQAAGATKPYFGPRHLPYSSGSLRAVPSCAAKRPQAGDVSSKENIRMSWSAFT